jgi:hypothetical protein
MKEDFEIISSCAGWLAYQTQNDFVAVNNDFQTFLNGSNKTSCTNRNGLNRFGIILHFFSNSHTFYNAIFI